MEEYKLAQATVAIYSANHNVWPRLWTTPLTGILRLHLDTNFSIDDGLYRVSGVVITSQGKLIFVGYWPKLHASLVMQAETLAILLGLRSTTNYRLCNIQVYSDAVSVVSTITSSQPIPNEDIFIIEEIHYKKNWQ